MPSDTNYIACRGLSKRYRRGSVTIEPLADLDLDIVRGEFVALMGPSGSGKTTLLNLLGGIDSPSAGTLTIGTARLDAMSRSELTRWRATNVGFVFQLYHLVPVLSAYENVELPLLLQPLTRGERHRRVSEALERVGIADRADHYPRQLSGGQEQRVAIARAIVADPAILLADEPTGDLDRESAGAVMALLDELNRSLGKTIVMVTHDPRVAACASRTLHLEKGRLAEGVAA